MKKYNKVLESEKYIYLYYEPINEEDEAKFFQVDKATKDKKWVNLSEWWDDIYEAKEISEEEIEEKLFDSDTTDKDIDK